MPAKKGMLNKASGVKVMQISSIMLQNKSMRKRMWKVRDIDNKRRMQ